MAGGISANGIYLSSTEIYEAGQWTEAGALPVAVRGLRGATVLNTVYMVGGSKKRDDIWKYDADTQQWEKVGRMSEARSGHAVSTFANKDRVKYCNN